MDGIENILDKVKQLREREARLRPLLLAAGAAQPEARRSLAATSLVDNHTYDYRGLIARIRATVRALVPERATVAVVSKGDDELLRLDGPQGWHFPQTADGTYAGYHPRESAEAVAHLEDLRGRGAQYLLIPETALWWLEYYADFRRHLGARYRLVRAGAECVLYCLADDPETGSWALTTVKREVEALSGRQADLQNQVVQLQDLVRCRDEEFRTALQRSGFVRRLARRLFLWRNGHA